MSVPHEYGLFAYSGGVFCERYWARSDPEAIDWFLCRSRTEKFGAWNADLFRCDPLDCLVCMRADIEHAWRDEWRRAKARLRWLYVRHGDEWLCELVDPDLLGV